jgi:DNA-binding PadR family transcriptional regulator
MNLDIKTPLKQIDCVLHFMASDEYVEDANGRMHSPKFIEYHHIYQGLSYKYPELWDVSLFSIFDPIMKKLQKDGRIEFYESDAHDGTTNKVKYYFITFEGKIFSLNGGYLGEYNRQNEKNIRLENVEHAQREDERRMRNLTRVLAVFAGVMALFELMKLVIDKDKTYAAHCMEIVTVFLVFLVGVGTGLLLYIGLSEMH